MLIGIVLSIPFLVFSVYTVLTVYIDENGYMSPSSAFIKIHSNQNSKNAPALTMEDVLNESNAVMKQRPDIILKIPGIFNKAFNIDKPQTLNLNINKVIDRLKERVEQFLENNKTRGSLKEVLTSPIFRTKTTYNGTNTKKVIKLTLKEKENLEQVNMNSSTVSTPTVSPASTKLPDAEHNSSVTTQITPLVELKSTVTTPIVSPASSKPPVVEQNSSVTTQITPPVKLNSTVTAIISSASPKPPVVEQNSSIATQITPIVELNSTLTTPIVAPASSKPPVVEQNFSIATQITPIVELNSTLTTPIVTPASSKPPVVEQNSSVPTTKTPPIEFNSTVKTPVVSPASSKTTLIELNFTVTTSPIATSPAASQKPPIAEQSSTTPESLTSKLRHTTITVIPASNEKNQTVIPSSVYNAFYYIVDIVAFPVRQIVSLLKYIGAKIFRRKDKENIDSEFIERLELLFQQPLKYRINPNTSRNHTTSTTEPNKSIFVEFGQKDTSNLSQDKDREELLPLSPSDNPIVEIIEMFLLNKSDAIRNSSIEDSSRYGYAVPLQATAQEDSGYSLYSIIQVPTDYLTGFIGMLYSCVLPTNTTTTFYSIKDCPTCSSGSQDSTLYITCESSFVPADYESIVCHMGEWVVGKAKKPVSNGQFPVCKKYKEFARCPQLTRNSDLKWVGCAQRGHPVDCETNNITWYPGTELEILCPPSYRVNFEVIRDKEQRISSVTQCDSTGQWSRNNVSCKPACGLLGKQAEATPLVMNGRSAPSGYLPWVTALFLKDGSSLEYICSASIINNRTVVTAAHCVYTKEPGEIFILAGSTELKKNETAFMKVSEIKIPFSYSDKQGNYGSDIALLVMASPFQFSDMVQPICVDWDDKLDFTNQALGKVAGWGLDQNFKEVLSLKFVDLPLVSVENCSKEVPVGFRKFFSYTSFCAGYTNGTGVCNGDSGAGYMLEREGLWYLAGTVSISPRQLNSEFCQPKSYALYTKAKLFTSWIKSVMDNPVTSSTSSKLN